MLGVDEAGRGPAIGSMFVACVAADPETLPAAVQDSKQLDTATIISLAHDIVADADISVTVRAVTASHIDTTRHSITTLTAAAMAETIDACVECHPDDGSRRAVIDAGHTDAAAYRDMVMSRVRNTDHLTVHSKHRADESHAVVSAASIIAKALREIHVATLHAEYTDFGSGYPHDPDTQAFLETIVANGRSFPDIIRESWSTVTTLAAQYEQATMSTFETE